jgi:hypothetical protein
MKSFVYLPNADVYLVLAVWQEVSGINVFDYYGASKLVRCIEVEVKGWNQMDTKSKAGWLHKFLNWIWVEGKTLKDAWRYLTKYVVDTEVMDDVKEVVEAYRTYVKQRFGKDVYLDLTDKEVIKASRIIKKVAQEEKLSVYEVIKYQHECWERISEPLVFERMANESLVKRRLKVHLDEQKRQAIVTKDHFVNRPEDDMEKLVAKYWKNMLSIGVMFYTQKKGWLADIAREYCTKLRNADEYTKARLKLEYSVEEIVKRWKEEGCPKVLLS